MDGILLFGMAFWRIRLKRREYFVPDSPEKRIFFVKRHAETLFQHLRREYWHCFRQNCHRRATGFYRLRVRAVFKPVWRRSQTVTELVNRPFLNKKRARILWPLAVPFQKSDVNRPSACSSIHVRARQGVLWLQPPFHRRQHRWHHQPGPHRENHKE